jgi:hypothetical protein
VIHFWAWQVADDRDQYGAINHNPTDHAVSSWNFNWKAGGINIQSAHFYADTDSAVAFTAPENGYYTFDAQFENMTNLYGTTVQLVLSDMTTVAWSDTMADTFLAGGDVTSAYNGTLALMAGETVYFSIPVPEPTMVDFNLTVSKVVITNWDFAAEYSDTTNPNGVWTYGMLDYHPASGPRFLPYGNTHTLTAGTGEVIHFWAWQVDNDRDQYGAINHNPTDHAVSSWGFRWKPGGINIQSSHYYEYTDSAVAFTAREDGQYTFDATFESMTDARGTEVAVVRSDYTTVAWSDTVDAFGGADVIANYTDTLTLNAGETVYFVNPSESSATVTAPSMVDFNLLVEKLYCEGGYISGDLNQDCYVNLEDFALLASDWMKCSDPANAACDTLQ